MTTFPPGLLSAFVTMLVTIGPIETAVIFAGLTAGVHRPDRRGLAARSVTIAGVVLGLFAVGGGLALSLLHVSLAALAVQFVFDGLRQAALFAAA